MEKIEGWVLKTDLEALGRTLGAIPVFIKNFLGYKSSEKLVKVTLYIENSEDVDIIDIKGGA